MTPSNGFTGTVNFSVSGLPSGATGSFSTSSVSGSGSSTLSVNTSSSAPTGTYSLTITSTSSTLTHTAQVILVVADFTISATPSRQIVNQGSQTNYTVTITPVGQFSATVNLSVAGLPRQTSTSFNPRSVARSGSSALTVSVRRGAARGQSTFTITRTGGGLTHSTTVSLVVQ